MSQYGDEYMYDVPAPVYGGRKYGARTVASMRQQLGSDAAQQKKKKRVTPVKKADKKGSAKTTGVRASEFRYATMYKALATIAKGLGGVPLKKNEAKRGAPSKMSWAKSAVMMISSALEYKIKQLFKKATSYITFNNKKTVNVDAVERAAIDSGVPASVMRGPHRQAFDADEIVKSVQREQEKARVRDPAQRAAMSRTFRSIKNESIRKNRQLDFNEHMNHQDGFEEVSAAVSKSALKNLLLMVGAERSSVSNIHLVIVPYAYGFLNTVVRNIIAALSLHKAVRVSDKLVQNILDGMGITSVGFSGINKINHKRQVNKEASEVRAVASQMAQPAPISMSPLPPSP